MEEKEVILNPEQARRRMQFIAYLNNKFANIDAHKRYEKWRKDGMWKAIITGEIVENTRKNRENRK